ncbi:unnamed protein product [Camellia sinensis]
MLGYEGMDVINPEGGKDDAEEEAQRGRWKQEKRRSCRRSPIPLPLGTLGWPFLGETISFISCAYSDHPVTFMDRRRHIIDEAATILLPQTPDKMRELVELTFYKPPKILPSCVLTDFILVSLTWKFVDDKNLQHECIPQAILGMDVICQAKSGMGKTAVFVLSTLQQIEPVAGQVAALVMCHTRELAYQICHEFERFSTYLPDIKVAVFYGGVNIKVHKDLLKNECPHIVVGTPGRILWPWKLFQQLFVEQCCWTSPAFVNSCVLSWMVRISHRTHHQNHGHVENDESWVPLPEKIYFNSI